MAINEPVTLNLPGCLRPCATVAATLGKQLSKAESLPNRCSALTSVSQGIGV